MAVLSRMCCVILAVTQFGAERTLLGVTELV